LQEQLQDRHDATDNSGDDTPREGSMHEATG
jgi:hypothetical protein